MNILIVKLGALGDVLRTTPLLSALKKTYPNSRVTWVVDPACADVLEDNRQIDRLIPYSDHTSADLAGDRFDLAVNLDKEQPALEVIGAVHAKEKRGFGRSADGQLCAIDSQSEYAYRLGVDDELKFRQNKKTYQQISFEQLGLNFQNEPYVFPLNADSVSTAKKHLQSIGAGQLKHPVIGINTGAGTRFAGKRLPEASLLELIRRFKESLGAEILLLGGKDEQERNLRLQKSSNYPVFNTGSHPIKVFAAIVAACDIVLSGDTTGMHIAIAMKVPVLAYFASTCGAEIELYGRGRKFISSIDCAPCYKKDCPINEKCMKDLNVDELFKEAAALLGQRVRA